MKPIVIENAVPELLFRRLQSEMMSFSPEWHYMDSTAYRTHPDSNDASFTHTVLFDGQKTSDLLFLYESALLAGLSKTDIKPENLIRLRCGMFVKSDKNYIHPPHVDYEIPHKVALLYLNDSDGDTFLYNEKYDRGNEFRLNPRDYYTMKLMEKVTVDMSIKPKENTMVVFDGLTYHSSSSPVESSRRIVINCNFT